MCMSLSLCLNVYVCCVYVHVPYTISSFEIALQNLWCISNESKMFTFLSRFFMCMCEFGEFRFSRENFPFFHFSLNIIYVFHFFCLNLEKFHLVHYCLSFFILLSFVSIKIYINNYNHKFFFVLFAFYMFTHIHIYVLYSFNIIFGMRFVSRSTQ